MSNEIVTALIGVTGVVIAALITAITKIVIAKNNQKNKPTVSQVSESESKRVNKLLTGTLVDFFEGVTDDHPAKVEIAVNEDGRIILFYNLPLKVHLTKIEYVNLEKRLTFVADDNQIRYFGMPLDESVTKHLMGVDKILLVRLNEKSKSVHENGTILFRYFE